MTTDKDESKKTGDTPVQGDVVGRDQIVSSGGKGASPDSDVAAAKLEAKRREAEAEAAAEAAIAQAAAKAAAKAGAGGGNVRIQSGGFGDISGSISAGGNIVAGDMNLTSGGDMTITTTTTTGMTAEDFAKLFDVVYKRIEQLPPSVDKADVREVVETIEAEAMHEATEGKPPDEKMVKLSAQSLLSMAPDILDVIVATLANPAAGVATVIRKVLDKAKAAGSAG